MGEHEAEVASVSVPEELTWMVNKFGGTSVASASAMRAVKEIIMAQVDT